MPTWSELQLQLCALREEAPRMRREHPDSAEFFHRFADRADAILRSAPLPLAESVYSELGAILRDLKLADDGED